MQVMTGHHKEITALSVHPSGKLALSTSRDGTLRIWDLIKGRCSYHNILPAVADGVSFSPSGSLYALQSGSQVTVHNIGEEEGLVATLQHTQRVLCMTWLTDATLLTGCEDGSIHVWDARTGQEIGVCKQAHKTRIRGLVIVPQAAPQAASQQTTAGRPCTEQALQDTQSQQGGQQHRIASAASDGSVKIWHLDVQGGSNCLQPAGETLTGARLTCLCLVKPAQDSTATAKALASLKNKKRKAASVAKQMTAEASVPSRSGIKKPKKQLSTEVKHKAVAKLDIEKVGVAHNGVVDFTATSSTVSTRKKPFTKQLGHRRKHQSRQ